MVTKPACGGRHVHDLPAPVRAGRDGTYGHRAAHCGADPGYRVIDPNGRVVVILRRQAKHAPAIPLAAARAGTRGVLGRRTRLIDKHLRPARGPRRWRAVRVRRFPPGRVGDRTDASSPDWVVWAWWKVPSSWPSPKPRMPSRAGPTSWIPPPGGGTGAHHGALPVLPPEQIDGAAVQSLAAVIAGVPAFEYRGRGCAGIAPRLGRTFPTAVRARPRGRHRAVPRPGGSVLGFQRASVIARAPG